MALIIVTMHLISVSRPSSELRLILVAVAMGLVLDSLLVASGWLDYPNGQIVAGLAPYWILAMWALFATTLNVTMRWMRNRYWLAAAFGLVGGPLSYLAGQRLGAVQMVDGPAAVGALALGWMVAMPLLVMAAERFDGVLTRLARVAAPAGGVR